MVYMNRFIIAAVGMLIINMVFASMPFMFPRLEPNIILPYQVWFNVIFIFVIILPSSVGNFKLLYKN